MPALTASKRAVCDAGAMPVPLRISAMAETSLPISPRPQPGEHPGGYFRRLALANGFERLSTLRTDYGLVELSPESDDRKWARLAVASGRTEVELETMRWRPSADRPGARTMFGGDMRLIHAERTHMDVCPTCLRSDGVLRLLWSLHLVTACPIDGGRLTNSCPGCGARVRQNSRGVIWECEHCRVDLRDGAPEEADAREIALSTLIAATAGPSCGLVVAAPHSFPATVAGLPLNDLLTIGMAVGSIAVAADDDRSSAATRIGSANGRPEDAADMHAVARAAHDVLAGWPHAYRTMLDALVDRNEAPTQQRFLTRRLATDAGLLALRPMVDVDDRPIRLAADEFARFREERLAYKPGQRLPSAGGIASGPVDLISRHRAMELLEGNPNADMRAWTRSGLLERRETTTGREAFAALDVADLLQELAARPVLPCEASSMGIVDARQRVTRYFGPWDLQRALMKGPLAIHCDGRVASMRDVSVDEVHLRRLVASAKLAFDCNDDGDVPLGRFNLFLSDCGFGQLQLEPRHVRGLVRRGLMRESELGARSSNRYLKGYPLDELWAEVTLRAAVEQVAVLEPFLPVLRKKTAYGS